jgi:hypothetical protein
MAFEKGRPKTGGRQAGTRNNINMFGQNTIDAAKAVIAKQVAKGDIEASKLVLSYSLSKPVTHQVGIAAELEQVKSVSTIKDINRHDKDSEFLDFDIT